MNQTAHATTSDSEKVRSLLLNAYALSNDSDTDKAILRALTKHEVKTK